MIGDSNTEHNETALMIGDSNTEHNETAPDDWRFQHRAQ